MKAEVEIVARTSVLEFLLEIVIANNYAMMEDGKKELEVFKRDAILKILFRSTSNIALSREQLSLGSRAGAEIAERFFERTEARRAEIEKKLFG